MKFISLFAGIGGFDVGLESIGMEGVGQCEKDEYCSSILGMHWPDTPRWGDIRDMTGTEVKSKCGKVNLICGGFPCQPFSHAGKRKGKDDDRYLWPEMLRVIDEVKPEWVLGENVAGIVNMALDTVLSDLDELGYDQQTFIIPACAVGAPHRRDRVWIVGARRGSFRKSPREGVEDLPPVERPLRWRDMVVETWEHEPLMGQLAAGLPEEEFEGLEEGWQDVPVPRVAKGIPERVSKLKALGNAVVPPLVAEIGHVIMDADRKYRFQSTPRRATGQK